MMPASGEHIEGDRYAGEFNAIFGTAHTLMTVLRLRNLVIPVAGAAALAVSVPFASAQGVRIENPVAIFSALDKVTARISKIEVPLNQTAKFGSLKVTPRVCYSRPATERPKTTSYVEINEVLLDGKENKLFSGWMFAESPALNAVEHPVFDVWLSDCKGGAEPAIKRRAKTATKSTNPRSRRPRRRRVRR